MPLKVSIMACEMRVDVAQDWPIWMQRLRRNLRAGSRRREELAPWFVDAFLAYCGAAPQRPEFHGVEQACAALRISGLSLRISMPQACSSTSLPENVGTG